MSVRLILIFCVIYLSNVNCTDTQYPTNICVDSQKFKFDGLQVNSVYKTERSFTFNRIKDLIIDDAGYDFDDWDCPINKTMCAEDKELYNNHILKIYSESFFDSDVKAFHNHRKYVKNIMESFMDTKRFAEDTTNTLNCRKYAEQLNQLIQRIRSGYQFVKCLTEIKENRLCRQTLPSYVLEEKIREIILNSDNSSVSFRNKPLSYYYSQPLIKATFKMRHDSLRFLSLESDATLKIDLFIPVHLKNYDANAPCLKLDELPEFYQSI